MQEIEILVRAFRPQVTIAHRASIVKLESSAAESDPLEVLAKHLQHWLYEVRSAHPTTVQEHNQLETELKKLYFQNAELHEIHFGSHPPFLTKLPKKAPINWLVSPHASHCDIYAMRRHFQNQVAG